MEISDIEQDSYQYTSGDLRWVRFKKWIYDGDMFSYDFNELSEEDKEYFNQRGYKRFICKNVWDIAAGNDETRVLILPEFLKSMFKLRSN